MTTISNNNMNNRMSTSSTAASNNNNNNNNNNAGTGSTTNHQRRRSSSSISSFISSSWLWRTIKKLLYDGIIFIIRYIILYPIRMIQNIFFNNNDYDDATSSPAVSAKNAQQFITYLRSLSTSSTSSSVTNANTSDVSSGSTATSSATTTSLNRDNRIMDGWYISSFENAKQDAIMKQCLLVVYIYSPFHAQSDNVAINLLNTNMFLDYINQPEHIIAIGISIHTSQGMKLSNILNITSYPALIVLQPESAPPAPSNNNNNRNNNIKKIPMQVIFRAESVHNLIPSTKIMSYLISILTRYQVIIIERNMLKIQRDEEILLRKQQDDEYNNTLLIDQEREIRKKNEILQKEYELKQLENELKQKEIEEKLKNDAELNRIKNIQLKKLNIRPEPNSNVINNTTANDNQSTTTTPTLTATTSPVTIVDETTTMLSNTISGTNNNSNNHQITSIRFVLPNGTKLNRKFYYDDTIDTLRSYIQIYYHETIGLNDIGTVGLSTNFPKQSYNDTIHTNQTLYDIGLYPQAVLMVQDLDL